MLKHRKRGRGGGSPTAPIVCSTLGRRHQRVAQCCRNIQTSLTSVWVYKKFVWVIIEMLIKYIFKNLKTLKKLNHDMWDTLLHYKIKNEN